MIKKPSIKSLKNLSDKELSKTLSVLEIYIEDATFEYYRRQALQIKNVDPQYYNDHFKKTYR